MSRREGRRVTQGMIDRMAELRRQGLTFEDIGSQVGRSERTARRYVGHVKTQIQLPGARENEADDPRELRAMLGERIAAFLHRGWDRWPSAAFLAEVNRQTEDRLAHTDAHTLRFLARDAKVWSQFVMELIGPLYRDFVSCQSIHETMQQVSLNHEPFLWQPPHERPVLKDDTEDVR